MLLQLWIKITVASDLIFSNANAAGARFGTANLARDGVGQILLSCS